MDTSPWNLLEDHVLKITRLSRNTRLQLQTQIVVQNLALAVMLCKIIAVILRICTKFKSV
jgi:hypothetical protein